MDSFIDLTTVRLVNAIQEASRTSASEKSSDSFTSPISLSSINPRREQLEMQMLEDEAEAKRLQKEALQDEAEMKRMQIEIVRIQYEEARRKALF